MEIRSMQLGMIETNCYIFWQEGSHRCGVVDPGDQGEQVVAWLQGLELEPEAILLTHSHFDHISGIFGLQARWPQLPVYCHPADIDRQNKTTALFGSVHPTVSSFANIREYQPGQTLTVASFTVEPLHTPGHTPGSVSLRVGSVLFTGDTLFQGSIGRTDLPGGNYPQIMASLKKLALLEGDYQVFPGHNDSTTLDRERRTNHYMREAMTS